MGIGRDMSILNLEKITKRYGERTLFDGVSLGINDGDKIGIVGVNGTGKSTFLKIAAGIETPDSGSVIKSNNITISYLPQMPVFTQNEKIIDYVAKGAKDIFSGYNSDKPEHEADNYHTIEGEAKSILTKLGISDFEADIMKLSGGQKKRIALARVLVRAPQLLILDEPTNHLDNDMVIWLEDYIKKFKGQLMMVTHDRYFLDNVTNRIVEIDKAKLYSYAENYSGFLKLKTERENMEIATEAKRRNMLRTELAWIQRGCQARSTKQQARIDRYEDMKEASRQARNSFEKQNLEMSSVYTRLGRKTIELNNISKSFGDRKIIDNFTYIFLKNDRVGFIGCNGCGKSTLMKIISQKILPDEGCVETGPTVKLSFFMQENEFKDESVTVLDYVKSIGEYVVTTDGRITASQMCERFLFSPSMQWTPISKLSGGEKRRLYLLSVLMESPNVLILDEPTNDLDIQTLEILEDYLDGFVGIVITVSHDRYFLDRVVDRIFAFEEGGSIRQYEGGFSDYYEKSEKLKTITGQGTISAAKQGQRSDGENSKKNVRASREHEKKLRFTYAEQKEFESIDDDIAKLEDMIKELDEQILLAASQYTRLNELMLQKAECEAELEIKMDRWVYLNDLNDQIKAQSNTPQQL